jgi:hypothetical protein
MPAHDLALLHGGGAAVIWPAEPAPDFVAAARILSVKDTSGEALRIGVEASESEEVRKSCLLSAVAWSSRRTCGMEGGLRTCIFCVGHVPPG